MGGAELGTASATAAAEEAAAEASLGSAMRGRASRDTLSNVSGLRPRALPLPPLPASERRHAQHVSLVSSSARSLLSLHL